MPAQSRRGRAAAGAAALVALAIAAIALAAWPHAGGHPEAPAAPGAGRPSRGQSGASGGGLGWGGKARVESEALANGTPHTMNALLARSLRPVRLASLADAAMQGAWDPMKPASCSGYTLTSSTERWRGQAVVSEKRSIAWAWYRSWSPEDRPPKCAGGFKWLYIDPSNVKHYYGSLEALAGEWRLPYNVSVTIVLWPWHAAVSTSTPSARQAPPQVHLSVLVAPAGWRGLSALVLLADWGLFSGHKVPYEPDSWAGVAGWMVYQFDVPAPPRPAYFEAPSGARVEVNGATVTIVAPAVIDHVEPLTHRRGLASSVGPYPRTTLDPERPPPPAEGPEHAYLSLALTAAAGAVSGLLMPENATPAQALLWVAPRIWGALGAPVGVPGNVSLPARFEAFFKIDYYMTPQGEALVGRGSMSAFELEYVTNNLVTATGAPVCMANGIWLVVPSSLLRASNITSLEQLNELARWAGLWRGPGGPAFQGPDLDGDGEPDALVYILQDVLRRSDSAAAVERLAEAARSGFVMPPWSLDFRGKIVLSHVMVAGLWPPQDVLPPHLQPPWLPYAARVPAAYLRGRGVWNMTATPYSPQYNVLDVFSPRGFRGLPRVYLPLGLGGSMDRPYLRASLVAELAEGVNASEIPQLGQPGVESSYLYVWAGLPLDRLASPAYEPPSWFGGSCEWPLAAAAAVQLYEVSADLGVPGEREAVVRAAREGWLLIPTETWEVRYGIIAYPGDPGLVERLGANATALAEWLYENSIMAYGDSISTVSSVETYHERYDVNATVRAWASVIVNGSLSSLIRLDGGVFVDKMYAAPTIPLPAAGGGPMVYPLTGEQLAVIAWLAAYPQPASAALGAHIAPLWAPYLVGVNTSSHSVEETMTPDRLGLWPPPLRPPLGVAPTVWAVPPAPVPQLEPPPWAGNLSPAAWHRSARLLSLPELAAAACRSTPVTPPHANLTELARFASGEAYVVNDTYRYYQHYWEYVENPLPYYTPRGWPPPPPPQPRAVEPPGRPWRLAAS